jgi:hypothetical protein
MAIKYVEGYVCIFGLQSWCRESSLSISDWAAWVQAVGSVAAVGAAIWVVWWQVRHARRERVAEGKRRLQVLWALTYHSRVEVRYARTLAERNPEAFHLPDGLHHKVTALHNVPTLEFPDADVAEAVVTIVESFAAFQAGIAQAEREGPRRRGELLLAHANAAIENFEFAERVIRRSLTERGADIPAGVYLLNGTPYPALEPASNGH